MFIILYLLLIASVAATPPFNLLFQNYVDQIYREQSKRQALEIGGSNCEKPTGNFYVRVFASCGETCCDKKFQRQCGGVLIADDQVLVPATCLIGYTCFKVCFGNDLCGEREPCISSKSAYLHKDFLDNVVSRGCMEENLGIIKITPFKGVTPISVAQFAKADCKRFVGDNKLVSFACGCQDNSVKVRRSIALEGVGTERAQEIYQSRCERSLSCSTIFATGCEDYGTCGFCGEDGSPLTLYGSDLIANYEKSLNKDFKKKLNPKKLYLIGIQSYYKKPCLNHNPSAFVCLQAYPYLFDAGWNTTYWLPVASANELLIDQDQQDLARIDGIYLQYGVDLPCSKHTKGIKALARCVWQSKASFLRKVNRKFECGAEIEDALRCGDVSDIPSCSLSRDYDDVLNYEENDESSDRNVPALIEDIVKNLNATGNENTLINDTIIIPEIIDSYNNNIQININESDEQEPIDDETELAPKSTTQSSISKSDEEESDGDVLSQNVSRNKSSEMISIESDVKIQIEDQKNVIDVASEIEIIEETNVKNQTADDIIEIKSSIEVLDEKSSKNLNSTIEIISSNEFIEKKRSENQESKEVKIKSSSESVEEEISQRPLDSSNEHTSQKTNSNEEDNENFSEVLETSTVKVTHHQKISKPEGSKPKRVEALIEILEDEEESDDYGSHETSEEEDIKIDVELHHHHHEGHSSKKSGEYYKLISIQRFIE